jgi:integrase/recombinase XerD
MEYSSDETSRVPEVRQTETVPDSSGPYNAPDDESRCSIESDRVLIKRWLAEKSARTQEEYSTDLRQFLDFVDLPLRRITLGHLQDYRGHLADQDYATSTQARKLSAIKSLFSFGASVQYFAHNVGAALSIPNVRNDRAQRILSESELWAILRDETNLRNHVLLRVFYASGGRLSDVEDLHWRDLQERPDLNNTDRTSDSEGGQVTFFGKGGKTRSVVLYKKAWHLVTALRNREQQAGFGADDDPVFRSQKGGCLSRTQIWRIVKKAATRAGVKLTPKTDQDGSEMLDEDGAPIMTSEVSPHWFRHAHASHALQKGADIELVRETLGHESIETTKTYLHAKPERSSGYYVDDAPDFDGDLDTTS